MTRLVVKACFWRSAFDHKAASSASHACIMYEYKHVFGHKGLPTNDNRIPDLRTESREVEMIRGLMLRDHGLVHDGGEGQRFVQQLRTRSAFA